jgi:hypothetical protein
VIYKFCLRGVFLSLVSVACRNYINGMASVALDSIFIDVIFTLLDDRDSTPIRARVFSFRCHVQTCTGVHTSSYPVVTGVLLSGGKAAGA